ncbi:MAG: mycofactocin-coupled SDR family oxidoreductase [Solirubrobacterales bacterium]
MSRVAVVTGAGRGIGAATVASLAAEGWRVLAVDRCEDDPRLPYPLATEAELGAVVAAANEAAGDPERVRAAIADVTDEAALATAVERAGRLGELEAIVANAGAIAGGVPAWELGAELQQAMLEINLGGVIAAARAGIPELLRQPPPRRGRFVATASAAATRGMPGLAAYGAAKAGVAGFVRGLAADLRGTGVTANAIAPGSTRTPLLEESARLYGLGSGEEFVPQQPLERLLEPAEVAALIGWLVGPRGAAVTGALLPIDGGLAL